MDNMFLHDLSGDKQVCVRCKRTKAPSSFLTKKGKPRKYCEECCVQARKDAANHRQKHPELVVARTNLWKDQNKDHIKAYMDDWHEANKPKRKLQYNENKEDILAQSRAYNHSKREENLQKYQENKADRVASSVAWAKANPERANATRAKHRASRNQATPFWLNKAHFVEIEGYYQWCTIFEGHQVDHVCPLQGKEANGLHVPWNLQILTIAENASKRNKMPDFSKVQPYIERPTLVIDADGFASLKFEE